MVKRKLTVGGLIGYLASVSHYHKYVNTMHRGAYVLCFGVSHMQFLYGMLSQVLCCPFSEQTERIGQPSLS